MVVEEIVQSEKLVDVRAEQKLLACLLKEQDAWMRLPEDFSPEALTVPLNRSIFLVVDNLYTKGALPDPIAVADALPPDTQSDLEAHGGWSFIDTLRDIPLDPKNVEFIAKDLLELTTRRRIEIAGNKIADMAEDSQPVGKIIENIELTINDIEGKNDIEVLPIGSKAVEFVTEKMAHPQEVPGLPSGFPELDKSIQGFQKGRLYVVGAPKKTGKSMILLNWAKHICINLGHPILWISTEHPYDDEFLRLLALTSEVQSQLIGNGLFADVPVQAERVAKAVERLGSSPFYFCHLPHFTLGKIRRITRKYARVYGVKVLFFDFIKMPETQTSTKEWQELGVLAYGLKALASTEKIPVLTASQINREGRKEWRAGGDMDSDFYAGSDRIAQAMDVGMTLRQPTKKENEEEQLFRVLEVTDNRHGPANLKMLLSFEGAISKLSELKHV